MTRANENTGGNFFPGSRPEQPNHRVNAAFFESLENRRLLSASTRTVAKAVPTSNYVPTAKTIVVDQGNQRVSTRPVAGVIRSVDDSNTVVDTPAGAILPGFQIEVRFPDATLTPSQKAVFTAAAARWQSVILGDQSNVTGDFFGTGSETIDDLVIEATGPAIDGAGGVLGQAGPTYIRNSNKLPISGIMQFDSADLASLEAGGELDEVILHEMGHVLGLGTLWDPTVLNLITGSGGADPRYTGAQAIAQYQAIFGVATTTIPVENTGGAGTANGHWREAGGAGVAFDREIMTGYLDSGVVNPLSRISIAQFADLGYTSVNVNGFDVFNPTNGGNAYPTIASVSDAVDPVPAGTSITLTGNSVADSNGSVSAVRFYRESNGIAGLQVFVGTNGDIAADTLVGTDTSAAGGWSAVVATTGLANGVYTYYAQPTDNQALAGVSVSTTHTIGSATSATPGTPDLAAATDTGASSTDNITNRDNSTAAKNLQFTVSGTVSGATVSIYRLGVLHGSAVASGATTTVTTNGALDVPDGLRDFTARQTEPGKSESPDSSALTVTIDTLAPTFSGAPAFSYITNKPRVTFNASEPLYAFVPASVTVTKTSPAPTGTQAYTATAVLAGLQLDFPGSPNGVLPNGRYTAAASAGSMFDLAGNGVSNSTTGNFFVLAGDANHDATVNFLDFLALQTNFGSPVLDFSKGDFNYDGLINFNDFLLMQTNFGVTV